MQGAGLPGSCVLISFTIDFIIMRKFLTTFSLLLVFLIFSSAQEPARIKVMTYNVRFGELATLQQLGEFISEQDPDIVALQELDWMTTRERAPHQNKKDFITELGYYTGMFPLYGKTIEYAGGLYGIGILTKKPYINIEKIILPKAENVTEYRAVLIATIELNNQDTIIFASTHIDYSSYNARIEQIETVVGKLEKSKYPVLLAGDLNSKLGSNEINIPFKDWVALSNNKPTSPANAPQNKIDYIFGYPRRTWKLNYTETKQCQLSDHLPIISEVELISDTVKLNIK